jgi:hypothetical protein
MRQRNPWILREESHLQTEAEARSGTPGIAGATEARIKAWNRFSLRVPKRNQP